jgi:SAM-dependent methyltransferase
MKAGDPIEGVESFLDLEARSRVLDLCCGDGRRTIELARRGHRVLGLDPDERELARARAAARGERLNVHFAKADPRAIPYRADFDAILFLGGAFGRLPGERDDLRALESARKALKPGAWLVLDVPNRERELGRLEDAVFDLEAGRLDDGARLYALTELKALLERAGLEYRGCRGGFDGSAYALDSPRLIVLARRPREDARARRPADDGLPKAIRIKGRR